MVIFLHDKLEGNLTGISDHTCTFLSNKISLRTHFNIITLHLFNPEKKLAISSKSLSSSQFCYFSNHGNLLLWLFYFGFGKIKMTNKLKQTWQLTVKCDCPRRMRSAWSFTLHYEVELFWLPHLKSASWASLFMVICQILSTRGLNCMCSFMIKIQIMQKHLCSSLKLLVMYTSNIFSLKSPFACYTNMSMIQFFLPNT